MQLQCVMIYVKDFPRMKEFYEKMLRAQAVSAESTGTWALFETNGTRIALHAVLPEYARDIEISSPPKPRETSPLKLIFAVDDVLAERTRLEALGITMLLRPWQQPTEACDGIDPEGNVFQISAILF